MTKSKCINQPGGVKEWRLPNGLLHREDGPAYEAADGSKGWHLNGKRHRIDGPAIEHPEGHKEWWVNDKLHRVDGPAYEGADGTKSWWLRGVDMDPLEHFIKVQALKHD